MIDIIYISYANWSGIVLLAFRLSDDPFTLSNISNELNHSDKLNSNKDLICVSEKCYFLCMIFIYLNLLYICVKLDDLLINLIKNFLTVKFNTLKRCKA